MNNIPYGHNNEGTAIGFGDRRLREGEIVDGEPELSDLEQEVVDAQLAYDHDSWTLETTIKHTEQSHAELEKHKANLEAYKTNHNLK